MIDLRDDGERRCGEFEDDRDAARFKNSHHFRKRPGPVGKISYAEGDNRTIERRIMERKGERVGRYEVVDITDNSVTLADTPGLRYTLRLR